MMNRLETRIGALTLKNPVIAAPGEHLIDDDGIIAAIRSGVGAVVSKSVNETEAGRIQLAKAEYVALDTAWRPVEWGFDAPAGTMVLSRSGLHPAGVDGWLDQAVRMDRLAQDRDCLFVPSLVLGDLASGLEIAEQVAAAGLRAFELNIGTPYASEAAAGVVSTELEAARVGKIITAFRTRIDLPLWVKLSGQGATVPQMTAAAFAAGADSVIMAGRALGMLPDLETQAPLLSTSGGFGGPWNLPLTCHWLAVSRRLIGPEPPLIGINGATSGDDILRMALAGASAVGMTSEVMLRGFDVLTAAIAAIDAYLARRGERFGDLIGRAADRRASFADMPMLDENWRNHIPTIPAGTQRKDPT